MTWWQVFVLSVALLTSNISARQQRILNGRKADIKDFPYQASFRDDGRHVCGGSIISEKHILTAGHCIFEHIVPPYDWQHVSTGTGFRREEGKEHQIAKITIHPDYHLTPDGNRAINDIAVITLKDKIVFDKNQQKIDIPKKNFKVGQKVNLTGWGMTQQYPTIRPNQLQQLQVELISNEECQKKVIDPEISKVYDTEVCTNNRNGTGMCIGDSGGPLASNGEVIGIVSWTDGDYCGGGHPDVYTNVYKFKDFIESAMKG